MKYHWAQGALGTIGMPPKFAQELVEDYAHWDGWHRFVQGVYGPVEFYWVDFDQPQMDADGDGPYKGGEIESKMIKHAS